jgi:hypothetical protein
MELDSIYHITFKWTNEIDTYMAPEAPDPGV